MRRPPHALRTLATALVLTAAASGAAHGAGSTVFLRGGDLWLADAAGADERRLAAGSAGVPLRHPSVSDTGVVAVVRGDALVWLDDSAGDLGSVALPSAVASSASDVDVTPDGSRAAVAHSGGVRVVPRSGAPREVPGLRAPRWVQASGGAALAGVGGDGSTIVVETTGGQADWIGLPAIAGYDTAGAAEGRAVVLGVPEEEGSGVPLDVLTLTGPAPANPDFTCSVEVPAGAGDPQLSRDAERVYWTTSAGLWMSPTPTPSQACAVEPLLVVPGASSPDTGARTPPARRADAGGGGAPTPATPPEPAAPAGPGSKTATLRPSILAAGVGTRLGRRVLVVRLRAPSRLTAVVERAAGRRWVRVRRVVTGHRTGRVVLPLGALRRGAHRVRVTATPRSSGTAAVTSVHRFPVR